MRGRVEKQLEPGRSGGRRRRMSIRRRSSHCGLYSSRSCSSPQGALISRRRLLPTGDGFGDIRRRANLSSRRPRVGCLARDFARCRAIPSVSEAAARRNGTFCIEPERECCDSEVRKLKFASVAAPANFGPKEHQQLYCFWYDRPGSGSVIGPRSVPARVSPRSTRTALPPCRVAGSAPRSDRRSRR